MAIISVADLNPKYQAQVMKKLQQQGRKPGKAAKASKYHNQKTVVNGIRFDSLKEARRYQELMEYQARGYITDLRLQQDFTLQEAYTTSTGKRIRAIRYKADFTYHLPVGGTVSRKGVSEQDWKQVFLQGVPGQMVVEDAKGFRTDVFKMKEKMMADRGYVIREI